MRYVYSVLRFVPDPVRGEFVNVGVIVGSDESSEWDMQTLENHRRARAIDENAALGGVWVFIDGLGRALDEYTDALAGQGEPRIRVSEEWLTRLSVEARNVVQLSPPAPITASTLPQAMDVLLNEFILEPRTTQKLFVNKHSALAAVRRAYSSSGLRIGVNYKDFAVVQGAHHKQRFDFIVFNGSVVQLAQAWSFQVPGQDDLAEKIKAWAWTVRDIRNAGGEVKVGDREVSVPPEVDVSAVYVAPTSPGESPAFEEALSAFQELRVTAVPASEAKQVADLAARLVHSHDHN